MNSSPFKIDFGFNDINSLNLHDHVIMFVGKCDNEANVVYKNEIVSTMNYLNTINGKTILVGDNIPLCLQKCQISFNDLLSYQDDNDLKNYQGNLFINTSHFNPVNLSDFFQFIDKYQHSLSTENRPYLLFVFNNISPDYINAARSIPSFLSQLRPLKSVALIINNSIETINGYNSAIKFTLLDNLTQVIGQSNVESVRDCLSQY